ncbi:chromate efflux transporter [Aquabacterium sp. A08]|uniref:chromate efflux transporter n=1 Tax=Aquabacterium sp. A08 TaxID=2718532 RepID=UPI001422130C|nr:chromate efflux transporter [Aquabacterium sp. A08]NIC43766.1 chromate efflux transporter [Aquabacterium sp. A08]
MPTVFHTKSAGQGKAIEVLLVFLKLGMTSFGGPVAHLGHFRHELVQRRGWMDDQGYADVVALCQFLPGPASSQVGLVLGLHRAGWLGAFLAWVGFTLPSAVLLIALAYAMKSGLLLTLSGAVHGLKVVAVAVVAQAVWGMARTLCPDRLRLGLAGFSALLVLCMPSVIGQMAALGVCGCAGWQLLTPGQSMRVAQRGSGVSRRLGAVALGLFGSLLLGLPVLSWVSGAEVWRLVDGFYRAGSLVFGGGHVVLPLLQSTVVPSGAVALSDFLAGYGAVQAMPGPLFAFSAYLGAVMSGPWPSWAGGLVFLFVIFVPAVLLVVGALPFWDALRLRTGARAAMAGVNAGVVGVLLATLYDPVWTGAIHGPTDVALSLGALVLLLHQRMSPVLVALLGGLVGWWLV